MFSTILIHENADIINFQQLSRNLRIRGYSCTKPKRGQLQSGLSTAGFIIKKNCITIIVFVMKLGQSSFLCSAYLNHKLINEKQLKSEGEIINFVDQAFASNRQIKAMDLNMLEFHMENIRNAAIRTENKFKEQSAFLQEMKISDEYSQFLNYEKQIFENVKRESQLIIRNQPEIKKRNKELMEMVLKVEDSKQSLENVVLAYEDQKQYLSNTERIFKELIEEKEKEVNNLSIYELNETLFEGYLDGLIAMETVKIKAKAAGV